MTKKTKDFESSLKELEDVVRRLEELGHTVQRGGRQGSANSIGIDTRTGERVGAPDPRSADSGARGR